MIQSERPALMRLISDCKLLKKDSKVSFDAVIEFIYDSKEVNLDSKVIIVSAEQNNHDILFLLNVKLIAMQFPETFRNDKDIFSYQSGSLVIKGHDRNGRKYKLTIHPLSMTDSCNQLN